MSSIVRNRKHRWMSAAVLPCLLLVAGFVAHSQADEAAGGPKAFDTPKAAVEAVIAAAQKNDDAALAAIFGKGAAGLVQSGKDPVVAKERAEFVQSAKEFLAIQEIDDGKATVVIGSNKWPVPVPLKKVGGKWVFDVEAGREEILARRIGRNELRAISLCRIYVDAQIEYASADRDGDRVREYAQVMRSAEGKKDGLYWPSNEGEAESPLGPLVASWREHLDPTTKSKIPVGGYYFRILHGQGPSAPGCRHCYIINGNMIAGFALVAYPAKYGDTGVMSFMVSHHGTLYERDLGPDTAALVKAMRGFNPVKGWKSVKE